MGFSVAPDNFVYFLTLFCLSFGYGVYTLLSYRKTLLNYINALVFFLCAARAATEYILQHVTTFEVANKIMTYHSLPTHAYFVLCWGMLYYYVSPFKNWKQKKAIDAFVGIVVLLIPGLISLYWISLRILWTTSPVMIDGYWAFKANEIPEMIPYLIFNYPVMGLFTLSLMIYSIVYDKKYRWRKVLLAIFQIVSVYLVSYNLQGYDASEWTVSAVALKMFINGILLTWFISGYRLFDDGFNSASGDLLNSISDLSIQTNKDLDILITNEKVNEAFSLPKGGLIHFLSEKSRYHANEVKNIIDNLINQSTRSKEIELIDKDGATRLFQVKVSDLHWRGKRRGYTFLLSDLTEQKEKEIELAKLNNAKDQIFSMIAHDLRNPALAFKGVTNKINYLIKKQDYNLLSTLGDSIEKSSYQLNSLLDNLLKWALSQKNLISAKNQPFVVNDILQDLMTTFEIITKEKGITINNKGLDKELELQNDPDLFQAILRNLVDNAIKYSETDSTVYVNSYKREDQVVISVKDSGRGMTQEQMDSLFKIYKNKNTAGTHGEQGSGLGLNLVHDLVGKTGGQISCVSTVGVGTTFELVYS